MTIWISSLAAAPALAAKLRPSRIVSLLSPYDDFPTFAGHANADHLRVPIHDIVADIGDWRAPDLSDAEAIIGFVKTWDPSALILVHCWAGISRSTATAFITACVHNPGANERDIAQALRAASPTASPNRRLVSHADDVLGRGGRMVAAIEEIGRGEICEEALPFSIPARFAPGNSLTQP